MDWLTNKISSRAASPSVSNNNNQQSTDLPYVRSPPPESFASLDSLLPPSCLSCDDPCSLHPHYPKMKIDRDAPLEGTMKPYGRHVLICTGKWDWPSHIDDEHDSLAAALNNAIKKKSSSVFNSLFTSTNILPSSSSFGPTASSSSPDLGTPNESGADTPINPAESSALPTQISLKHFDNSSAAELHKASGKTILQNISRESTLSKKSGSYDVILYPDNIIVSDVHPRHAELFYDTFLAKDWIPPLPGSSSSNSTQAQTPIEVASQSAQQHPFTVHPNSLTGLILICSHRRRDKRCGIVALILQREFERELEHHNIASTAVDVHGISHIGGHKYAGNVLIYSDHGRRGIWYGRVEPCHAIAIVETSIVRNEVIRELYRGGMDYSFGAVKNGLEW